MIEILISWFWIGISAFLWGFVFMKVLNKISGYERKTLDSIIMLGLCFLTVYAEIFSLFYKVGGVASGVLLAVNIVIFFSLKKEITIFVIKCLSAPKIEYKIVVLMLCTGLILMISSTAIHHYDTYLYHAQSIRWIEEYGIVQGLGNLHNRLAYNSAVFPLQALFSMKFLVGRSLHSINGFIVVLMLGYALCTMKIFREKRIFVSDFLRLLLIIFLLNKQNCGTISSPGSDILALGLVVYILTKWMSYWEDGERNNAPYVMLSLLGVYAVSVKLSAAMIVLLTLMPAVDLIRNRKWREITAYISLGVIIIAPFLIRNIIISGYLVYPYPEMDLFNVDWKMPEYTLLFDRNEIKAWGWGLNDACRFDAPFIEWFPVWMNNLGNLMRKIFYLNMILLIPSVVYGIFIGIVKKEWNTLLMIITMITCFALWFIGSPLPRYGSIFLMLLPIFMLGKTMQYFMRDKKAGFWGGIYIVCILFCIKTPVSYLKENDIHKLKSPDYYQIEANEIMLGNEIIYTPINGDQMGYYKFPSTPYGGRLDLIELRENDLRKGFKMKEEYKDAYVTTYGQVDEENLFEEK